MPRRAAPGDRAAIEAALTPTLRDALGELCDLLNLWDWQQSPLCAAFQQVAVVLYAARLVGAGECSEKDALDRAAIMLEISADTVRSRSKRWPPKSRSLCTPTTKASPRSLDETLREVA